MKLKELVGDLLEAMREVGDVPVIFQFGEYCEHESLLLEGAVRDIEVDTRGAEPYVRVYITEL